MDNDIYILAQSFYRVLNGTSVISCVMNSKSSSIQRRLYVASSSHTVSACYDTPAGHHHRLPWLTVPPSSIQQLSHLKSAIALSQYRRLCDHPRRVKPLTAHDDCTTPLLYERALVSGPIRAGIIFGLDHYPSARILYTIRSFLSAVYHKLTATDRPSVRPSDRPTDRRRC